MLTLHTIDRVMKNCVGANQKYASYNECISFLQSLPFGTPSLNSWNSTVCRWWHSHLTYLRPDVHCNHVAPDGGGKCVNFSLKSRRLGSSDRPCGFGNFRSWAGSGASGPSSNDLGSGCGEAKHGDGCVGGVVGCVGHVKTALGH